VYLLGLPSLTKEKQMNTYLVGYDLNKPGQYYTKLINALQAYPNWWHHLDSTWVIKSALTTEQIRNDLKQHIDASDELLVVRLSGEAAWYGFNQEGSQWLMTNLSYY
jgi:hypothetical protein